MKTSPGIRSSISISIFIGTLSFFISLVLACSNTASGPLLSSWPNRTMIYVPADFWGPFVEKTLVAQAVALTHWSKFTHDGKSWTFDPPVFSWRILSKKKLREPDGWWEVEVSTQDLPPIADEETKTVQFSAYSTHNLPATLEAFQLALPPDIRRGWVRLVLMNLKGSGIFEAIVAWRISTP